jgi:3-deoxy-D-manno-octulosonic-acid transferase
MSALGRVWAAAATLARPGLRLMLRTRLGRGKELPGRLAERRGIERAPRPDGKILWLHAASVGEAVSIVPVLQRLAALDPELTMLVTTGTVTSARLLERRLDELGLHQRILHRFVPLDVPRWVNRFLEYWRPEAAAFVESELWPNLLAGLRIRGIPTMMLNARMSGRSYAGWLKVPGLARQVLSGFASIHARTEQDADRLRVLGARHVTVPGDLKFAADPLSADLEELARLRVLLARRPVWLAASTHPGEESVAIGVHENLAPRHPGLLTILVPRHPQRGSRLRSEAGHLPVGMRSVGEPPPELGGIWIADTIGELGLFYRLTQIAFVGRSLFPPGGGQNPLEPARLGCAIAVGPHTGNFAEAVRVLATSGALTEVADGASLAAWVDGMLGNPAKRAQAGAAAIDVSDRYAELPGKAAAELLALMA